MSLKGHIPLNYTLYAKLKHITFDIRIVCYVMMQGYYNNIVIIIRFSVPLQHKINIGNRI